MFKKLISAVLGAAVLTAYGFFDDGRITGAEGAQIGAAAVAAYLVWQSTNGPKGTLWGYAKTAAYGLTAGLGELVIVLPDGVTAGEWFSLAVTVGAGVGVWALPGPEQGSKQ